MKELLVNLFSTIPICNTYNKCTGAQYIFTVCGIRAKVVRGMKDPILRLGGGGGGSFLLTLLLYIVR